MSHADTAAVLDLFSLYELDQEFRLMDTKQRVAWFDRVYDQLTWLEQMTIDGLCELLQDEIHRKAHLNGYRQVRFGDESVKELILCLSMAMATNRVCLCKE